MPNGFENLNTGLRTLQEGLSSYYKKKKDKQKEESLREFGTVFDTYLAANGASEGLRKVTSGMVAGSTG